MPEFEILGDIVIAGSRILVPVNIATVTPGITVPVSGTVTSTGTVQQAPAHYVFTSVSATVEVGPGVLYSVAVSGESGLVAGPGTLLILDGTATVAIIPVAPGGFQNPQFGPGVRFGTLIASVIGSVNASFSVM